LTKSFLECRVRFFSINAVDEMNAGQAIESVEVQSLAVQETVIEHPEDIDGFLVGCIVHSCLL
jgi:hypothetical protein